VLLEGNPLFSLKDVGEVVFDPIAYFHENTLACRGQELNQEGLKNRLRKRWVVLSDAGNDQLLR
jgi:hypothetical protein